MRLAIVGTGLIGASAGMAARGATDAYVIGYDAEPQNARRALERGALDEVADSLDQTVRECDLILLATPLDRIGPIARSIAADVAGDAVVTDTGSAKVEVVRQAEEALGPRFVGGHPMAGSELHGPEAGDEALFEGASWILTPTQQTSPRAYRIVGELVLRMGATPVALDPAVHDALLARLSHLPQLLASALVELAAGSGDGEALLGLAASGFRDVTRIAASDPDMWIPVLRANHQAVLDALDGIVLVIERLRDHLTKERWEEVRDMLARARRARTSVFTKPLYTGDPVPLWMLVPDRPGVLAEVTTAAGELGANIEDLRIVHSTEGGRGRLELVVAGREPAELLTTKLRSLGYHVERGPAQ